MTQKLVRAVLASKAIAYRWRRSKNRVVRVAGMGMSVAYRAVSLYVLGFDIPSSTRIDGQIHIHHTHGLVVSDNATLAAGVQLRQNTTIGSRTAGGPSPILETGADIGANSVILGGIRIGKDAIVGAGSVVISDVPAGAVAVGNPARILEPKRGRSREQ